MTPVKTLDPTLLSDIPAGTWVAISSDQERVVGTGQDIEEALRKARENGEEKPFVLRVPAKNSALIL